MIKRGNHPNYALTYSVLTLAALTVIVPVLWMVSTSLKTMVEMFTIPPVWIPKVITWEAFSRIWVDYPFGGYFWNSLVVVASATLISLAFSALAGYGVSRFQFRGKGVFLTFLLITQMFPSIMLLIPYYKVMRTLGLINTYTGLTLAYVSFTIPFCSWMMLGYFQGIPKELDAAASIDGCGKFRTFAQILLPLTLPGLAATAIYSFLVGWNEYMFAMILTTSENMKTVPVGIGQLIGQYRIAWNDIMAVSLVASVPLTILFLFLQKYLVSSLTAGAVKQ
ncbi:carbohydrate ABC transporter membrane protein 2 (CUT1 family) [Hydrogenispora ethanolica]|uniref:Carbohydrate ABC transporter membrane protein 2 (CUT1 family) n=1 Tax=Hydrogenispora ethanolica TaxID=1082276 RepID=A0A4R1SB97_HYDET|nr:carbohydrate ABC transporter permease [Hydrogenispora ethanolica]TCL76270.1 carbohydrate ABC transporter membrane protein 2 (CUT1 family) [Hydrogenispora ethanolica]